jgi:7-cyano-7-deazaguanine synthase
MVKLLSEGREVLAISFKYGQKHSVELKLASKNIEYLQSKSFKVTHQIVDLTTAFRGIGSSLITEGVEVPEGHYQESNMKSTVVPNRNAIFSAIIYAHALSLSEKYSDGVNKEPVDISLGIHSGDHEIYPDCRIEFRDAIDKAFKLGNYDSRLISYYTPYINGTKTSILHDCLNNCKALDLSFPTILANTITSYNPDELGRSSGKSGSDIERIEAFLNLGLVDPIAYQEPWEEVVKHAMGVLSRA